MSEWKEFFIEDLADFCNSKRIPLSSMQRAGKKGHYPYYGASGIVDYVDEYIFDGSYILISEDGENLKTRKTPIAFEASGQFWVNNHAHILKAKKPFLTKLIILYFSQLDLSPYLTGAVQPKLNKASLGKIPLFLPSCEKEQQAIASVLSVLDDKIDLLQRQNQTLEQMAATLFRQWFIEEAKEEWEEVTIGDLCAIVTKGTTPKSFTTLGVNFIKAESLSGNGAFIKNKFAYISEEVHFNSLKRSVLQKGDLLFSIAGTIGRVAIVTEDILPANTNQALAILRPREINYSNFIYCILKSSLFQDMIDSKVVHAVQPNLSLGEISNSSLRLPKKLVLNQFVDLIEPFFIKIRFNIQQLETLQSLRDTLLPKLISGEVRLKGFETLSEA